MAIKKAKAEKIKLGGCCLLGFCGKERQELARAEVRREREKEQKAKGAK